MNPKHNKMKILAHILAIAIFSPLAAWNYYAGSVALFRNHPSYFQVLLLTAILLVHVCIDGSHKSLLCRILRIATLIAFIAWVVRLVGIMPNAPF